MAGKRYILRITRPPNWDVTFYRFFDKAIDNGQRVLIATNSLAKMRVEIDVQFGVDFEKEVEVRELKWLDYVDELTDPVDMSDVFYP